MSTMLFYLKVHRFMNRLCPNRKYSAIGGSKRRNLLTFRDIFWYLNSYSGHVFMENVSLLLFYYFHDTLQPSYAFYSIYGSDFIFDIYTSLYLPAKWIKMSQDEYFNIWTKISEDNFVESADNDKPTFYVSRPSYEPRRYVTMMRQAQFLIN